MCIKELCYITDTYLRYNVQRKKRSKYTRDIYITNLSYSNKVGIVFAMYQRMTSKGKSWDGPRYYINIYIYTGIRILIYISRHWKIWTKIHPRVFRCKWWGKWWKNAWNIHEITCWLLYLKSICEFWWREYKFPTIMFIIRMTCRILNLWMVWFFIFPKKYLLGLLISRVDLFIL